ncbi:unnamed protein product [Effrenium voratum]|uniref:FCP1 homology domain-containing protein n=1 Tax=Effrenium voratum TaxID=2562239 RepID=A0AA36NF22_9DINO|nr:unnamed protein product [Effrenium voratum]CAJ1445339.1 unnamed protein product [Effrenium voratum]
MEAGRPTLAPKLLAQPASRLQSGQDLLKSGGFNKPPLASLGTPEKSEVNANCAEAGLITPPKGSWSSYRRRAHADALQAALTHKQVRKALARSPEPHLLARTRQRSVLFDKEEKLCEFSVMSPHHGASAAEYSWEDLSPQLRHTLEFLRKLPFLPRTYLGDARPFLPPSAKPTLVLDLDETLVHCFRGSSLPEASPDLVVEFDESIGIGRVYFRPFVQLFLEVISRSFDVVVFTASQQAYADQVINALDPSGSLISHRLYRQHCTEFCGAYFKELSLLGRPLSKCILVDNSPISVACNAHNGVLIRSWYGDLQDQELLALLEVLEDMRKYSRQGGCFDRYLAQRYGLYDFFQAIQDTPEGDFGH